MRIDQARAYVEDLLEKMLGLERLYRDPDGDYPVRYADAGYYVRIIGIPEPVVQVFSTPVVKVDPTESLFAELNSINTQISFARVFWIAGQVLVETEVLAESLDRQSFENACVCVGELSMKWAPELLERHGGEPGYSWQPETSKAGPDSSTPGAGISRGSVGPYL